MVGVSNCGGVSACKDPPGPSNSVIDPRECFWETEEGLMTEQAPGGGSVVNWQQTSHTGHLEPHLTTDSPVFSNVAPFLSC